MKNTLIEKTLPAYWASYLINGDDSGLQPGEREEIDAFLKLEKLPRPIDCGESFFKWVNDANCLLVGGDVCVYLFDMEGMETE